MSNAAHSTEPTRHTDFAASPAHNPWHGVDAIRAIVPGSIAEVVKPSFPLAALAAPPAPAPLPGTVPATVDDPWRPLQHLPASQSGVSPRPLVAPEGHGSLDAALTAAQLATVARSRAKLDRARSYAGRLGTHAAEIRAKLAASSDRQAAAAIGRAEPDAADAGPLRGELIEVERQHRQALDALAGIEAEHARHEADLAALTGSDGAARAKLAEAHQARAEAQSAADAAKSLLDRASAHAEAVLGRLELARSDEARHDAEAAARLRAALADGDVAPSAAEPFARTSGALEDDLRAATAAVDALKAEHAAKAEALTLAHRAVLAAVDGVLAVDAEAAARELEAADARALALRVRLHCFVKRTAGAYVRPEPKPMKLNPGGWYEQDAITMQPASLIRSTPVVDRVIGSAPQPPHQGPHERNWTVESASWDAYAAALAADPQAEPAFADRPPSPPAPPLPVRAA